MLDVGLRHEISYPVGAAQNTVLYVLGGSVAVRAGDDHEMVDCGQALALSGAGMTVTFEAVRPAHLLVLSGAEIDEPVVADGPFIMNDQDQMEAATSRYASGGMGRLSPVGARD